MTFADTSFLIALILRDDDHHAEARELLRRHSDHGLVLTNHVLGETWTLLRRWGGHRASVRAVEAFTRSPRYAVHHAGAGLERDALEWLRRHDERTYSFVDAVSFAFMRDERIGEALSFDGDFGAAGFTQLRA